MNPELVTAPTAEPVTWDEAKLHLRLDGDSEKPYVEGLIAAARADLESRINRAFIRQTRRLWMDRFPPDSSASLQHYESQGWGGAIRPPLPPLVSVSNIKYVDNDGILTTVSAADYQVEIISEPGRIVPAFNKSWPTDVRFQPNAVQVEYLCGYADAASVPQGIKQAILLLTGHWYENREATARGEAGSTLPHEIEEGLERLIWSFRVHQ